MGTSSSADDISDEVRGRIDAGARHLRNIHDAPHPEQKKKATASLAETMLWLRKNCRRLDGEMDLRGKSRQYKEAIGRIRAEAGEPGSPLGVPAGVKYKVSELLFQDPEIGEETRSAYGFGSAPSHIAARQKYDNRRSRDRAFRRSSLVDNLAGLICDVEQLELSKLIDADESEREKVVEQLIRLETSVRERRDEIGEIV
ncbi:hypothetical protein OOZ19_25250 [Saccharopolyspora sp. NFXS83]|uniref:hypothetical protein n=1 Tax=Saccharopolyspora sp. NFXS83 TaxID=2993560 RepID=UPI00224AA48F|nr:hypothetical protein [Saccharopolyspora sp. NFXS83]MCX2733563.1 hypothetical protein [Saccharopolyspora sp. NFXS83]